MLAAIRGGELAGLGAVLFFGFFVIAAFVAYTIKGQSWENVQRGNAIGIVVQAGVGLLGLFVIALLMVDDVIKSDAGTPILSALVGFAAGKTLDAKK
jgi:hypothetical protein